jgi:chemotaxis methyl-accepting protein methylase
VTASLVENPPAGRAFGVVPLRNLLICPDEPTREPVVEHCAQRPAPEAPLSAGRAAALRVRRPCSVPPAYRHGAHRPTGPAARFRGAA